MLWPQLSQAPRVDSRPRPMLWQIINKWWNCWMLTNERSHPKKLRHHVSLHTSSSILPWISFKSSTFALCSLPVYTHEIKWSGEVSNPRPAIDTRPIPTLNYLSPCIILISPSFWQRNNSRSRALGVIVLLISTNPWLVGVNHVIFSFCPLIGRRDHVIGRSRLWLAGLNRSRRSWHKRSTTVKLC